MDQLELCVSRQTFLMVLPGAIPQMNSLQINQIIAFGFTMLRFKLLLTGLFGQKPINNKLPFRSYRGLTAILGSAVTSTDYEFIANGERVKRK